MFFFNDSFEGDAIERRERELGPEGGGAGGGVAETQTPGAGPQDREGGTRTETGHGNYQQCHYTHFLFRIMSWDGREL